MPSRSRFIKTLRELGYEYKKETTRTLLYKKRGSPDNVFIPKNKEVEEEFIRGVLRREGWSSKQIDDFLQESEENP